MKVTLNAFETINKNQVNLGLKSKKNNTQNNSTLNLGTSDFVYSKNASEALKNQNVTFGTALPNRFFNSNRRRRVNNAPNFVVSAGVRHYLDDRASYLRRVNDIITRINNVNNNVVRGYNNNRNAGELIQEPRLDNNSPLFIRKQRFLQNVKNNLIKNASKLIDKEPELARNMNTVLQTIRLNNTEDIKRNEGKLYLIQYLDKFHEGNMDKGFRFSNNLINETFFNNNSFVLNLKANEEHADSSIYVVPKEGNNEVVGFKIGDSSLGNVGLVEFDVNYYDHERQWHLDNLKIEAKDGAKISGIKIDKLLMPDNQDELLDVQNSTLTNAVEISSYIGFWECDYNTEGGPHLLRTITDGSSNLKLNNEIDLPRTYGVLEFYKNTLYMDFEGLEE